jgi:hypothetical protein
LAFHLEAWKPKGFCPDGRASARYIFSACSKKAQRSAGWLGLLAVELPSEEEGEGEKILVEEKDHDSQKQVDEILDEQICPFLLSGGIGRETTAVQVYASVEIYRDGHNENHQQKTDQQGGAFGEKAQDQKKSGYQFNPGKGDGEDVYQKGWQNLVVVDYPGELLRMRDLIQAGVDEGRTQDQSKYQHDSFVCHYNR